MEKMVSNRVIVSLCLPTNGIVEWVFPTLNSIYCQGVEESLFEVIVTDNGKNSEFKEAMRDYARLHRNLVYSENDSVLFENQLEALKLANGEYLKFINHRGIFEQDALPKMIERIQRSMREKPVIFFSNGSSFIYNK